MSPHEVLSVRVEAYVVFGNCAVRCTSYDFAEPISIATANFVVSAACKQLNTVRRVDMPPKKAPPPPLRDTLPSSTLIPPSALLRRFLTRLPKSVIIDLVLIWLDHPLCPIHEPDDEEDLYMQDDETLDDKKAIYAEYRDDNVVSKSVVIDKILMNDWV